MQYFYLSRILLNNIKLIMETLWLQLKHIHILELHLDKEFLQLRFNYLKIHLSGINHHKNWRDSNLLSSIIQFNQTSKNNNKANSNYNNQLILLRAKIFSKKTFWLRERIHYCRYLMLVQKAKKSIDSMKNHYCINLK